jgi:outer membrane protein OmpA-like peptidoglycan-associated protein
MNMLSNYKNFKALAIGIFVLLFMHNTLLGQETTPSGKPNRFIPFGIGESINTSYDEINPVFSPDEKTVYFSRVDHPDNHYGSFRSQDIWFATLRQNGTWSEARRLDAPFNNNRYNAIYSVTDEGAFMVSGVYKKNGTYKKRGLSLVTKTADGWSTPTQIKMPKINQGDKGLVSIAYLSKTGDEMFLSYAQGWQRASTNKLRYSHKKGNGKWKSPKVVEQKVLGKRFRSIEAPFLSADDRTIYFSAYIKNKADSYQNDIYQMTRSSKFGNKWSDLKKVDNVVNSSYWDNYYRLFNESNWAVFAQAEVGDDADIFIVKLHEPKPYVDLSGKVLLEGQAFDEDFEIMINGQVIDSVRINNNMASYAVQLPLGAKYELQAKALDKIAKIEVIDAIEELEYLPLNRDLELSLLPFLDLSGIVTVNGSPLQKNFEVLVNGQRIDSMKIDSVTSRYSVKLPLGQSYQLEVRSNNYSPGQATVDVTAAESQIRIEEDLALTPLPYVDISGQLYNTETNALMMDISNPKVIVNGLAVDSLSIVNGTYKVRLPWGQKYILQLLVDEFEPQAVIIDLVTVESYQEISQDLYASPLANYAILTGKVINMKTQQVITAPFAIEVNGARSTNSILNIAQGTFEVRLSLGQKVVITGSADKFFPISEIIDLSAETENVKVIKDLQMMPLEVGERILLNNIFFEIGSTNLKPSSFADIDRVVDLMRHVPTLKIEISGHTDSSGKEAFNLSLSESRARSVAAYILQKGLADDRVIYKGYGESKSIASNLTPEGRTKNRRVEFVVLEQ